jgi:Fe-S oxidoreductase
MEERYRTLNIKKAVYFCIAGYNMTQNLLPRYFGARFDFDKVYLLDYLRQRMERGEIKLSDRASGTVTLHDPCHARTLGAEYLDMPRSLLEDMGYHLVEMEHCREMSLCCGYGNGAGRYSPIDIIVWSIRRLREAKRTGAGMIVTYCATCLLYLCVARRLYPFAPPVYHILDLLQMAIGEQPVLRHSERAGRMIRYMTLGLPRMLSPKRSWVEV